MPTQPLDDKFCYECSNEYELAWCYYTHNKMRYGFCSFTCRDSWKVDHAKYSDLETNNDSDVTGGP